MSKKQFEDIEDKIREAAENNQPQYQEAAWEKMNALLDKDGDKSQAPFWWIPLLLLLLAGGGYWYFNHSSSQNSNQLTANEEKKYDNTVTADSKKQDESNIKKEISDNNNFIKEPAPVKTTDEKAKPGSEKITNEQIAKQHNTVYKNTIDKADKLTQPALHRFNKKGKILMQSTAPEIDAIDETKKQTATKEEGNTTNKKDEVLSNDVTGKTEEEPANKITGKKENTNTATDSTASNEKKQEDKKNTDEKKRVTKANSTYKPSKFYFLASLGAEAASTKLLSFNNSKVSPAYGIGIGYSITKKLSIQAGFYAGAKKYNASHKDYHPKPGSYWSSVYIKNVDANCMVYEIPLTVRYSFIQKPKTEFFITAGASNYIMKKEDYMYSYMRNYMPYSGRYIYTGNKNLFSVLTFSAGIDKRLSQKFSLLVSPTLGIPVSGVGEGKVKLYSAGIIAGLKYQPSIKK